MKHLFLFLIFSNLTLTYSQQFYGTSILSKKEECPTKIYSKENTWIFILAGQSNMAGRAVIEPMDTIVDQRVLSINIENKIVLAKEPISFYEVERKGLSCGLAFGKEFIKYIPDSVSVLLIPIAVGGSSIDQWIGDSLHRNVKLLSNFKSKVLWAKNNGTIKGILWHQGESDVKSKSISEYNGKLKTLFTEFRNTIGDKKLILLTAEIGMFKKEHSKEKIINRQIKQNVCDDPYTYLINSKDFKSIGDGLHFDSKSQRLFGERFAKKYRTIVIN